MFDLIYTLLYISTGDYHSDEGLWPKCQQSNKLVIVLSSPVLHLYYFDFCKFRALLSHRIGSAVSCISVTGTLLKCPKVPSLPLTVQLGRRLSLAQVVYGPSRLLSIKPGLQHCLLCCAGAFPSIQRITRHIENMGDATNLAKVIGRSNATFNVSIHGLKLTFEDPGNVSFQEKFKKSTISEK